MNNLENNDEENNEEEYYLPDPLWHHVLSFCAVPELCSTAVVNKNFHKWSNQDCYWKDHCLKRWNGKLGTSKIRDRFKTWKQRYAWGEYDKYRGVIRNDEICYYSWKLIYNGTESRMGLRKFQEDGTYHSPYAGVCEWALFQNRLCFMGIELPISRNPKTWGWIIGKGHPTEYHSIEP